MSIARKIVHNSYVIYMLDLHLHTTYSDGASPTEDIIRQAIAYGLKAIAITDHDNTASYPLACRVAEGSGMEVIPGIEINTVWKDKEIHILGYYINPADARIQDITRRHRQARIFQIQEIACRLKSKAKLNISFEDIQHHSRPEGTLGRPHVAQAIVAKGGASTISEAFQRFLNPKAPTYLRRETVTPHEAVEAIYESGGIPVIAHPGDMEKIEDLVVELMNYGLRGLEAYHKSHSPATIEFHCTLAEKYGLIVTGGTDFHGGADSYTNALSRLKMPAHIYDSLKKEKAQLAQASYRLS